MQRRSFLASGLGLVAGASLTAGCIQRSDDDDTPERPPNGSSGRQAGLAPNERDVESPDADPSSFERISVDGTEVPLVPIDVAHPWYLRQEARMVDARSMDAYQASHVAGAVLSPAPSGYETDDPTGAWDTSERVITYCGCPHHLSSLRAASLIEAGYENVYALDEGFNEWYEREYPMASSSGAITRGHRREVSGTVDASYAGEFVWLRHEPTGQREPADVAADGSFTVTFRFVEIGPESTLTLETPEWTRTATVAELTSGSVGAKGDSSRRA